VLRVCAFSGFYGLKKAFLRLSQNPAVGACGAFGLRLPGIPLANWYGTGSGSDLAPCSQRLPSPPGRYRSLYRTVLRIRQRYRLEPLWQSIAQLATSETPGRFLSLQRWPVNR
jgi:hypothetical protein